MNLRIITLAAAGALTLAACSGQDDAAKTDAAAEAGADTSAMAPADGSMAPADGTMAPSTSTTGTMDGTATGTTTPPGQTPPTLPEDPSMTSPTTSPPAQ